MSAICSQQLGLQNARFTYNHSDMERSKWIEHFGKVDRLLRQVLQQGSPPFTPEENKHFQESLAAYELDVAFDLLCWKLNETGHQISQDVYDMPCRRWIDDGDIAESMD